MIYETILLNRLYKSNNFAKIKPRIHMDKVIFAVTDQALPLLPTEAPPETSLQKIAESQLSPHTSPLVLPSTFLSFRPTASLPSPPPPTATPQAVVRNDDTKDRRAGRRAGLDRPRGRASCGLPTSSSADNGP